MRKIFHFARRCRRFLADACKRVLSRAEGLYHITIIIATIVAGWWTYHLFIYERIAQSHLSINTEITFSTNNSALEERKLAFIDVVLENEGKRKLQAKRVVYGQPAYKDSSETLKCPCGIQIRKIEYSLISSNKALDWFNDAKRLLPCPVGIPPEIDLLGDYELLDATDPSTFGMADFWIEPTERYHLGAAFVLAKGDYLLKVHFIGNNDDDEFWTRIVLLQIR